MTELQEDTKAIAETYMHRVWNEKDLGAIDEFFDESCTIHSLLGDFHGKDPMKQVVQAWLTAFPDLAVKNSSILADGDLTAVQWQASGTHQGIFKGIPPTGKPVAYSGVSFYRIHEGKIREYWAYLDMQHLFNQLNKC